MDDDDIFNSITGGVSIQSAQQVNPVSHSIQQNNDDPFGLLNLNVGVTTQSPVNQNAGFDMGLLGFGNSNPSDRQPSNNGSPNLLEKDFLGMGTTQPVSNNQQKQPVNNIQQQNNGFNLN